MTIAQDNVDDFYLRLKGDLPLGMYVVCPDAILQWREGSCFFSNPRTRTHVCLDSRAAESISRLASGSLQSTWIDQLTGCTGYDAGVEFFGAQGLHADHTGLVSEIRKSVAGEQLFWLLCRNWLLTCPGDPSYDDYLCRLTSVLDRAHLGTFHQRVGQFLGIKLRLKDERWRWWHDQKFSSDGSSLKEGPYKEIQERFVDDYFRRNSLKGKRVLDFACGNGFYSRKFASMGAKVLGLDTSADLIGIAKGIQGTHAEFLFAKSIEEEYELLSSLNGEFDIIYMQDILLLLINPEGGERMDISLLLKLLRQSLKNSGSLYLMEPNATFWLAGYYGDSSRPYAIVPEYMNELFNVMPILPVIIDVMYKAGFALIEYEHPRPLKAKRASKTNEFPTWDFMRFVPLQEI